MVRCSLFENDKACLPANERSTPVHKDGAEEQRSRRIAGPYPVGDISFSGWKEGIVSLPYQILSFRCLDSTLESVRLLSFCFHLITDVKGLYPLLLPLPHRYHPPWGRPPTFCPHTSFSLPPLSLSIIPLFIPIIYTT